MFEAFQGLGLFLVFSKIWDPTWYETTTNHKSLESHFTFDSCSSKSLDCTLNWTWPASRWTDKSPRIIVQIFLSYLYTRTIWYLKRLSAYTLYRAREKDCVLFLNVLAVIDLRIDVGSYEVSVIRQPANNEDQHHHHHHLHHLKTRESSHHWSLLHCLYLTFLFDLMLSAWASVASPMALLPHSSSPTLL